MHRVFNSVLLMAAILVAAGCSAGSSVRTAQPSAEPGALSIVAKDLKFSTTSLSAPAGKPFQIVFDNEDGVPHNLAIYTNASASDKVFGSDPFSGPTVVIYAVPALQPGTYFFRCDVHTNMSGELIAH